MVATNDDLLAELKKHTDILALMAGLTSSKLEAQAIKDKVKP